jgi:O-antigen ligase
MLLVWAWYALAGAGLVLSPPLLQPVHLVISAVLILRAIAFPLLRPVFPGNSELFWLVSSGFVGALGLLFLIGAILGRAQ